MLEMYQEGFALNDVELLVSLARLESGGQLVGQLEQEIMLSWAAMVFLTLKTLGLGRRPESVSTATSAVYYAILSYSTPR